MSTSRAICSLSALTLLGCVQRPPAGGGQSGEEFDEAAWQPCVEAGRSPVAAGAVAPNGVRIDDVVAAVNGSASLPFVWVDGSSTTLQLSLGTGADGVWVDMEPNTSGGADTGPTPAIEIADTGGGAAEECPDWLELDLRLGFFTDDGAFAEDRSMIEAQQKILDATPGFRPVATVHDQALNMARHLVRKRLEAEVSMTATPAAPGLVPIMVAAAAGVSSCG